MKLISAFLCVATDNFSYTSVRKDFVKPGRHGLFSVHCYLASLYHLVVNSTLLKLILKCMLQFVLCLCNFLCFGTYSFIRDTLQRTKKRKKCFAKITKYVYIQCDTVSDPTLCKRIKILICCCGERITT